jgi:hypothetical protein
LHDEFKYHHVENTLKFTVNGAQIDDTWVREAEKENIIAKYK